MQLQVHDFYTKEKLSSNRYHNILMANALFYILVSEDGNFKELSITIPKRYHYERFVSYGKYTIAKANEYNVLVDYIKNNKDILKYKWQVDDEGYTSLLEGLEKVLAERYTTCNIFNKWMLLVAICLKILVKKFCRSIKKC